MFEDAAKREKFVETFLIASWIEHLRQHERVTKEGSELQDRVQVSTKSSTPPVVAHLVAAEVGA